MAAVFGVGVASVWPAFGDRPVGEPLSSCLATDGDTLRCGNERIRLLGIDAPEMGGKCRRGRVCASGDPNASKENLRLATLGPLTVERVGTDRYGRTLALVASADVDLSCRQVEQDHAIYKPEWDNGGRLAALCAATRHAP